MLQLLSHVLAFSVLFIGSIFDLETSEVPDTVSVVGVIGGIGLHALLAFQTSSLNPLLWCLMIGVLFSIYGWGAYFLGMWGGADAFAMSVLGFAAPYSLSGFGVLHAANLAVNIMLVGLVYTVSYATYRFLKSENALKEFKENLQKDSERILSETALAAAFSMLIQHYAGLNGPLYLIFFMFLIVVYRFLKTVESEAMTRTVKVSELEGGEVAAPGQGFGKKVKGLTEEDIETIEQDEIKIKSGVRFVPVFPVALLITDVFGGGFYLISYLVSL